MGKDLETWLNAKEALLYTVHKKGCQPYSIPVVPDELRKWEEKAYEPKVVSIGPRFKGRKELLPMEEIKMRCTVFLIQRQRGISNRDILSYCMRDMLDLDAAVRASYGEEIKLDSYGLATIMLQDACFLLELLISRSTEWNSKLQPHPDTDTLPPSPAAELGNMELIRSDLTLLENQIPFLVLFDLFCRIFPDLIPGENPSRHDIYVNNIQDLVLSLFGYSRHSSSHSIPYLVNPSHILQLVHSFSLNHQSQQGSCAVDLVEDVNREIESKCATKLLAAGVRIVESEYSYAIPEVSSSDGVLAIPPLVAIPPLRITQSMEANWRNFIAWELHTKQCQKSGGRDGFTVRALLLNDLICCAGDVRLLKSKGVIVDEVSMSDRHLIDLLRSITNGVDRGLVNSTYWKMIGDLNTYYATNCVIGFPIIVWHYFSRFSSWLYSLDKFLRRGYNFVAALLTLLTVIQTCYAILSYHYPKNN